MSIGASMTHIADIASVLEHLARNSYCKVTPFSRTTHTVQNSSKTHILLLQLASSDIGARVIICSECSSIADGFNAICPGETSIMLVDGNEADIFLIATIGLARGNAMNSFLNFAPFGSDCSCFVLGKGGAVLVLESKNTCTILLGKRIRKTVWDRIEWPCGSHSISEFR